jgi:hypothetical protein
MLVVAILVDRSESTIDRQLREEHGDTRIRGRLSVWPPDADEEAAARKIEKADRRRLGRRRPEK